MILELLFTSMGKKWMRIEPIKSNEGSFFVGGLLFFTEVMHDFSDGLFDIVDSFAWISKEVPI